MAFSSANDINHQTIYSYHPKSNPVECIMKPLRKALKAAHFNGQPFKNTLNDFLLDFEAYLM